MPELPDRPNLDQLRHQARDLLDAARAGEPDALQRLGSVSGELTLAGAQLAIAREHGCRSWPALKKAVENRAQVGSTTPGDINGAESFDPPPAVDIGGDLEIFHDEHSVRVQVPLAEDPFTPNLHRWMGEYRPLAKLRHIDANVIEHPGKVILEVRLVHGLSESDILRALDQALALIPEAKAAAGAAGLQGEAAEALVRRWWDESSSPR